MVLSRREQKPSLFTKAQGRFSYITEAYDSVDGDEDIGDDRGMITYGSSTTADEECT